METMERVKIVSAAESDALLLEAVDRYHLMPTQEDEEEFELSSETDMEPLILSWNEAYDMEAEESNGEIEIEFDAVIERIKLEETCDDSKPGSTSNPEPNDAPSWSICRLCTNRGDGMIDMFVENKEYENIVGKIEECLPIVIRRNDTLSEYACRSCLDKLYFYHEFYRSVIDADQRLRTLNQRISTEVDMKKEGLRNNKETTTTTTVDDNGNNIVIEANAIDELSSLDPNSQDVSTTQDRLEFHENNSDSKPCYRDKCHETMTSEEILYPNVPNVDRQYKKYCCEVDGKQFRTRAELNGEHKKHCDDRPFQCEICRKRFYAGDALSRHRRLHANEKPYRCDQCGRRFDSNSSLTKHLLSHQAEAGNSANCQVCNVCKEVFADRTTADDHLKSCPMSKKKTKDRRIVILDLKEVYRCEYCRRCFTKIAFVRSHRALHSDPEPYVCVVCGARYSTYSQVTAHRMGHKKSSKQTIKDSLPIPKYFTCEYCDKKYLRFTNMNVHRRSCPKKKNWTCTHCGDTFNNARELSKHKKGETGGRK